MLAITQKPLPRHAPDIERVLDNATALKRGLVWCKRHGHHVLGADVLGARPEIMIETSGRCAGLVQEGLAAEIGSQVVDGVHSRVMCAVVEGCNVKWIERGC